MTLAEIIEEGRELERAMRADVPWEIWSEASRALTFYGETHR